MSGADDRKDKVIFDRQSAERIDRAVRAVEGTPLAANNRKIRYTPQSIPLRWGKVVSVGGDCDSSVVVRTVTPPPEHEFISDDPDQVVTLRIQNPGTFSCWDGQPFIGACVKVDDVVAYLPWSTTEGIMLNPYKSFDIRLECDSVEPYVRDVESLRFNEFDFDLTKFSYSGCTNDTGVNVRWDGLRVCDSYSAALIEHVKKLCFDAETYEGIGIPVRFQLVAVDEDAGVEGCDEAHSNPHVYKKVSVNAAVPLSYLTTYLDDYYLTGITITDCEGTDHEDLTGFTLGNGLSYSSGTIAVNLTAGDNISIDVESGCDVTINWTGMSVGVAADYPHPNATTHIDFQAGFSVTANDSTGVDVKLVPCNVATPTTIGTDDEDSENEDGNSWTITDDAPVSVWVCSRVGYFESGDQKLYGYARKLTFDKCGKLYSVSAETRYEVDVPEEC